MSNTVKIIRENFVVAYHINITSVLCAVTRDAEATAGEVQDLTEEFLVDLEMLDELDAAEEIHKGSVTAFIEMSGYEVNDREDLIKLSEAYDEAFIGDMTPKEYAEEYIEATGALDNLDETYQRYFDYEAFARDLVMSGDIVNEGNWLFRTTY